jgi:hypothetical protein
MADIVQAAMKATGKTAAQIVEEAYKADKTADYANHGWAYQILQRSGIVTKTVEAYCTKLVEGEQLPMDFSDYATELAGAME